MGKPKTELKFEQKFGRWKYVGEDNSPSRRRRVIVECVCGITKSVALNNLLTGKSQSCGCLAADMIRERIDRDGPTYIKHGQSRVGYKRGVSAGKRSPEYSTWSGMIQRCTNPKSSNYERYGAVGITVCEEWQGKQGFENFFAHVGLKPSPQHSLDRIYNDGPYEPGNIRWATTDEQLANRKNTVANLISRHHEEINEMMAA